MLLTRMRTMYNIIIFSKGISFTPLLFMIAHQLRLCKIPLACLMNRAFHGLHKVLFVDSPRAYFIRTNLNMHILYRYIYIYLHVSDLWRPTAFCQRGIKIYSRIIYFFSKPSTRRFYTLNSSARVRCRRHTFRAVYVGERLTRF